MDKMVKGGVAMAVFFVLAGALILPNFQQTQGELETGYEEVFTDSEWNDVVNTSSSTNYTISGDTVVLDGSSGKLTTKRYATDAHDRLEINVSHLAADTDVTVYDDNSSSIASTTISGDTDKVIKITDYSADEYYVEYAAATATDAEIDGYTSTGFDQVDDDTQAILYLVLLLFMVGVAVGVYGRFN